MNLRVNLRVIRVFNKSLLNYLFYNIFLINFFCRPYKRKKITTKIQKQIEQSIIEIISISEMITRIDRFIKGLESLNMSPNELKIVLDLLEKLDGNPRRKLIERLIIFKEFANKLSIKVVMWPKNIVFNIVESISKRKNFKIRHIDIDFDGKNMTCNPELSLGLICMSEYINIDTLNIISSDVEID